MASYLILDAYNVIRALDRYDESNSGGFDESRELLINDALKAAGWTGRVIIVVFDAHRSPEPRRDESRAGGAVRLIYSGAGESADDVIERLLGTLDGATTVYTADFALQRTALARGSTRATPAEFQELLDELPLLTSSPSKPRRVRVGDYLSSDTLRALEEVRRRAERR